MSLLDSRKGARNSMSDHRRGTQPADSAYLKLVGERVRMRRSRLGLSRKALSQASGVSERYLAELERGTGNASLLVLRGIANALSMHVSDLARDVPDYPVNDNDGPVTLSERVVVTGDRPNGRKRPATGIGRIAIIGLRGAGKSTLGLGLAQQLDLPFVELDVEIANACGMDLEEIIQVRGESTLRDIEFNCLRNAMDNYKDVVIAAGGGIVANPETFELLLSNSFVVWAKASPDVLFERARRSIDLRSVGLSRKAMTELEAALAVREPLYGKAHAVIDTSNMQADFAIAQLSDMVISQEAVR